MINDEASLATDLWAGDASLRPAGHAGEEPGRERKKGEEGAGGKFPGKDCTM